MRQISYFLVVIYAACFLARLAIYSSKKSKNINSFLNFSHETPIAKIYTAPLIQNLGISEIKKITPFKIAIATNAFQFKIAILSKFIPAIPNRLISDYSKVEWPKICINAP